MDGLSLADHLQRIHCEIILQRLPLWMLETLCDVAAALEGRRRAGRCIVFISINLAGPTMFNQYHAAAAVACCAMSGLTTHAIADRKPMAQRIDSLPSCPVASTPMQKGWKTVITRDGVASFGLPKSARAERVGSELDRQWWSLSNGQFGYKHWVSDTARSMSRPTFICAEPEPGRQILVSYVHGHWAASLGWHFTAMTRLRNGDALEFRGDIYDPYPPDDLWAILSSIRIRDR